MKAALYAMLVALTLGCPTHLLAQSFIVQNNQPKASIVIAEQPTRMQQLAADQLQTYILKITGAELPVGTQPSADLPVTIYIGESPHTQKLGLSAEGLDYGAYRITSGDNWLAMLGNDDNYFMDKPGDAGPEYASRNSDRERAEEAWHEKHGPQWGFAADTHWYYNHEMDLWVTDNHSSLNAVNDFLRSLGVRWYMPGDFGEICPSMASIPLPEIDETVRSDWKQREMIFWRARPHQTNSDDVLWQLRLGMHIDTSVWAIHGMGNLIAPQWVKENHPDFYALYGNKRATDGHGKACLSSEGLFRSAVAFSKMMADTYGKTVITLTPTDAYMAICQCEGCRDQATPERGLRGLLSDYVWTFINRVATEVAKTHPDLLIRCHAYNAYREPPLSIDQFHPNVRVSICQSRHSFHDPETKATFLRIRDGFLEKLPGGKVSIFEYYSSRDGIPRFYPHAIAEDLQALEGNIEGTYIEVSGGFLPNQRQGPDIMLASRHLNLWLTGRLWFSPDPAGLWWTDAQDLDDLLDEYCTNFYGPAAEEMRSFLDYTEQHWPLSRSKVEVIDRIFELITTAHAAAGNEGLYAARIQLIIDYMEPLKGIREQLNVGRTGNPVATFRAVDKKQITLDGRLDEAIWDQQPTYQLNDVMTGDEIDVKAMFKVVWAGDSLYFAIRCEEPKMDQLVTPATGDGDLTMFDGDSIEILLETPTHAYYQIAIDPHGHVTDLNRPNSIIIGKTGKFQTQWEAGISVASHRGDDFWSLEVQVPALGADQNKILPDFGVSGDKPSKDMPWYFNLGRTRLVDLPERHFSTFSPTGESGYHYMRAFAQLIPE